MWLFIIKSGGKPMKKEHLFLCIMLLWGMVSFSAIAQTIKIPDPNFKKQLVILGVDLNGDGEIQLSEAQKVTKLNVDQAGISSLIGIKSFANLKELSFWNNQVKVLDLEGMKNLEEIFGYNNQIQNMNLRGLTNLRTLYVHQNKISTLDLTGLLKLEEIKMHDNALYKVDIPNLPKLVHIEFQKNTLNEFKVSGCAAVKLIRLS
jgi:Leucine-rich repeat (LRR) protein